MLLRSVANVDTPHARELGRQLEAPDSHLRMDTALVELEENKKISERLEIESPVKGRSVATNSSHKKSAKENGGESSHLATIFVSCIPRRPRGDGQEQSLQGQMNHSQQMHPQGQYSSFQTQADHSQAMPQMQQAS